MDTKTFLQKQKLLRDANRRLLEQLCPNGLDPELLSSCDEQNVAEDLGKQKGKEIQ